MPFLLPAWWRTRVSAVESVFSELLLHFAETFACQNNEQKKLEIKGNLKAITLFQVSSLVTCPFVGNTADAVCGTSGESVFHASALFKLIVSQAGFFASLKKKKMRTLNVIPPLWGHVIAIITNSVKIDRKQERISIPIHVL